MYGGRRATREYDNIQFETALHILCECDGSVGVRSCRFGKECVEQSDHEKISLRNLLYSGGGTFCELHLFLILYVQEHACPGAHTHTHIAYMSG
jgi:hypothetical protein